MKFVEEGIKFDNYEGNKFISYIESLGFKKGEIPWEQFRTPWILSFSNYPNKERFDIDLSFHVQPFNHKYIKVNLYKTSGKNTYLYFLCDDINEIIQLIKMSSGIKLTLK